MKVILILFFIWPDTSKILFQHIINIKIINENFIFVCVWDIVFEVQCVVYTNNIPHFRMAIFQVLSSDMWLVTAVLDS